MADAPLPSPQPQASAWPVPWQPVWGDRAGPGDHLSSWAVRAALAGTARIPEALLGRLVSGLAALAHRLDRRRALAAHEFLRQALGELSSEELERRTRAAWRHLLRVTVDTQRFLRVVPPQRAREHFELVWNDDLRRVVAEKRGCIIVTPHLGNWEAGLMVAPWMGLHPVYAVARPPKNRPLSRAIQAEREGRGIRMLHRKGAMRSAGRILAAGGAIALLLDHRTSGRSFVAPFFGRAARCDRSAGVLLKRHRVPVIVGHCLMKEEPLTYRVEFPDVLWPEEWAGAELGALVQRINAAMERLIVAHPEQYFWLHDRYKDTPREASTAAVPTRILRAPLEPGSRPASERSAPSIEPLDP